MAAAAEGAVIACHTEGEFDAHMAKAKEAGKRVVIDFTDPDCAPCHAIAPVFAACAKEYPQAVFLKVEVGELEEVADNYCVKGVTPTFVFIRADLDVTWESFVGAFPDKLRNTVKEFIDNPAAAASASCAV